MAFCSLIVYIVGTRRRARRMRSGRRKFLINFLQESLLKMSHFLTSGRQVTNMNNRCLMYLNGSLEST